MPRGGASVHASHQNGISFLTPLVRQTLHLLCICLFLRFSNPSASLIYEGKSDERPLMVLFGGRLTLRETETGGSKDITMLLLWETALGFFVTTPRRLVISTMSPKNSELIISTSLISLHLRTQTPSLLR